jgi:hypothetical protein
METTSLCLLYDLFPHSKGVGTSVPIATLGLLEGMLLTNIWTNVSQASVAGTSMEKGGLHLLVKQIKFWGVDNIIHTVKSSLGQTQ